MEDFFAINLFARLAVYEAISNIVGNKGQVHIFLKSMVREIAGCLSLQNTKLTPTSCFLLGLPSSHLDSAWATRGDGAGRTQTTPTNLALNTCIADFADLAF
jgi:hypothetical protein